MVKEEQDHEHGSTNEVDITALFECSKDELINALVSFAKLEQRYSSKYKDFKRNFQGLKQKNVALGKMNYDLHDKIRILENKNEELQDKCNKEHKIILKFTKGQENLDKLLCNQKTSFNKEEIGYNHSNKKKTYKSFFVK